MDAAPPGASSSPRSAALLPPTLEPAQHPDRFHSRGGAYDFGSTEQSEESVFTVATHRCPSTRRESRDAAARRSCRNGATED